MVQLYGPRESDRGMEPAVKLRMSTITNSAFQVWELARNFFFRCVGSPTAYFSCMGPGEGQRPET